MTRSTPSTVIDLKPSLRLERLDNGLRLCLLENRQAQVVTTALCYRVGARDEAIGHYGVAHFLEHMMFKGSRRFGPGEIDRRTQALGGSCNAFTTHDATAYYFSFASDRWQLALDIEADRMSDLTLDPIEVDAERDVILEELAMVRDDPWEALAEEVRERLYGGHSYGRSVLGDRRSLAATGAAELADFHRRHYRPDNAVLVVAGDLGPRSLDLVAERMAVEKRGEGGSSASAPRVVPDGLVRLERHRGDVARLLLALPVPGAADESYPALRMLSVVLATGRTSRLHRSLVDEGRLCSWVGVEVGETIEPGAFSVVAEVLPGVDPERVEQRLMAELATLRRAPVSEQDLQRARRLLAADWVFSHERIDQQALSVTWSAALFDPLFTARRTEAALVCDSASLQQVAERLLDPERGGVIGWSLPKDGRCR